MIPGATLCRIVGVNLGAIVTIGTFVYRARYFWIWYLCRFGFCVEGVKGYEALKKQTWQGDFGW